MNRLAYSFRHFLRERGGIAYLEFALSLPLLLVLFMGSVEVTRYIIIAQKLEKATTTMSDIVAQSDNITTTELDQLVDAVRQIMLPYSFPENGYVIVSSVTKNGTAAPRVSWQYSGGGTWLQQSQVGTAGSTALWIPFVPPNNQMEDKENIIVAEVFYRYTPLMSGSVIGSRTIYKYSTFKPRLGTLSALGG